MSHTTWSAHEWKPLTKSEHVSSWNISHTSILPFADSLVGKEYLQTLKLMRYQFNLHEWKLLMELEQWAHEIYN
jgi:hypothetical protein